MVYSRFNCQILSITEYDEFTGKCKVLMSGDKENPGDGLAGKTEWKEYNINSICADDGLKEIMKMISDSVKI